MFSVFWFVQRVYYTHRLIGLKSITFYRLITVRSFLQTRFLVSCASDSTFASLSRHFHLSHVKRSTHPHTRPFFSILFRRFFYSFLFRLIFFFMFLLHFPTLCVCVCVFCFPNNLSEQLCCFNLLRCFFFFFFSLTNLLFNPAFQLPIATPSSTSAGGATIVHWVRWTTR